jgi:tetratricopeptide (TPR) repeat protein
MADIFVSYTSSDRDWAFWIGHQLQALGHVVHIHEWEIPGGGDIPAWMEERQHKADRTLCVVSKIYLEQPYASWERRSAQWAAASSRPGFVLPIFIENCEVPPLFAHIKRCDLYGVGEEDARARLIAFLAPPGKPAQPPAFPGMAQPAPAKPTHGPGPKFPGSGALSNIPISVPLHFIGRDDALAAIATALAGARGRAAITALYGMRGVGKTTLSATYAEHHKGDYRATWWVRAQTDATMRADLVSLGVRLGWVAAEVKEEPALTAVIERLRDEGKGILLIFDNAPNADAVRSYLPRGGAAQVIVTSNSDVWRGIATPVEIQVWPKEVGADYLIARTGRSAERQAAEGLSEALGGLPLAHEQAAAYCERLRVSLPDYRRRFEAEPSRLLDDVRDAPAEHNDGMTVSKSFALGIEQASKLHSGAEPLIMNAALLPPEPIPLFLFAEAREALGGSLISALVGDGLDEAVAALRSFALVDREVIVDERDPTITTDCIRLHRLIREVARARWRSGDSQDAQRKLVIAIAASYPNDVLDDPNTWPRARRLDGIILELLETNDPEPDQIAEHVWFLLNALASYRHYVLADYLEARRLYERALAVREHACGPDDPGTATSLNNLAELLLAMGDLAAARSLHERALAIRKRTGGLETPVTAMTLGNLARVVRLQGDLVAALPLYEQSVKILEKTLGPEHPHTATALSELAVLLVAQGEPEDAREHLERAVTIYEKGLGAEHPDTNVARANLARQLLASGNENKALVLARTALSAHQKMLGQDHPWTKSSALVTANALDALGRAGEAKALRARYGITE